MTTHDDLVTWSAEWTDRRATVTLRLGGENRFVDKCDPASDMARRRLLHRLAEQFPAVPIEPIRSRLLAMAAEGPPKPVKSTRLVVPPNPEAWDVRVAGNELLDELSSIVQRHVIVPQHAARAVALWVVHTYVFDRFHYSPRLLVSSPDKRCGKSLLLRIVGALVARPLLCESISTAALYRTVEKFQPTLILDEADTYLAGRNVDDDLRGILNAGFASTGSVVRCVGDDSEPAPFSVFGPLALGMIGRPPGTVEDRSVVVPMRRKMHGEMVDLIVPGVPIREQFADVRRRVVRWTDDHAHDLATAVPKVPPELDDRSADCWFSLLAIADAAGGVWPQRAREAAVELAKGRDGVDSLALMLLADLRNIFRERRVDRLKTQVILDLLLAMEERPWPEYRNGKPINARQVARHLEPFGVRPDKWNAPEGTERGYREEDLGDAWTRYLPELKTEPGPAIPPQASNDAACAATAASVEGHDDPPVPPGVADRGATVADDHHAARTCEPGLWRQVADGGGSRSMGMSEPSGTRGGA